MRVKQNVRLKRKSRDFALAAMLAVLLLASADDIAAAHGGGFGGGGGHFGHFGGHGFRRLPHPLWRPGGFGRQQMFFGGGVIPAYAPQCHQRLQQSGAPCQETVTVTNERGGTSQITITRCSGRSLIENCGPVRQRRWWGRLPSAAAP